MSNVAVGSKVKVAFEGTVVKPGEWEVTGFDKLPENFYVIEDTNGTHHAVYHSPYWGTDTLKVDESYEDGVVYQDAVKNFWLFNGDDTKWWSFGTDYEYAFDTPVRPLTKVEGNG